MSRAIGTAAILALVLATAPAVAQSAATASDKLKSACAGDYFRFCAGMDPNGREVEACFRSNVRQMSPGCQAALIEAQPKSAKRLGRSRS